MSTVVNVGWTCGLRIVVSMLLVAVASVVQAGTVKVAVVGGIQLSGVWDALRPRLEAATGVRITLAAAANKAGILPVFVRGDADLLLIHGGAETFALQARGVGGRMSVWAYNEHAIVGPAEDPAGVHGSGDAATAFRRIAAVRAPSLPFVTQAATRSCSECGNRPELHRLPSGSVSMSRSGRTTSSNLPQNSEPMWLSVRYRSPLAGCRGMGWRYCCAVTQPCAVPMLH